MTVHCEINPRATGAHRYHPHDRPARAPTVLLAHAREPPHRCSAAPTRPRPARPRRAQRCAHPSQRRPAVQRGDGLAGHTGHQRQWAPLLRFNSAQRFGGWVGCGGPRRARRESVAHARAAAAPPRPKAEEEHAYSTQRRQTDETEQLSLSESHTNSNYNCCYGTLMP